MTNIFSEDELNYLIFYAIETKSYQGLTLLSQLLFSDENHHQNSAALLVRLLLESTSTMSDYTFSSFSKHPRKFLLTLEGLGSPPHLQKILYSIIQKNIPSFKGDLLDETSSYLLARERLLIIKENLGLLAYNSLKQKNLSDNLRNLSILYKNGIINESFNEISTELMKSALNSNFVLLVDHFEKEPAFDRAFVHKVLEGELGSADEIRKKIIKHRLEVVPVLASYGLEFQIEDFAPEKSPSLHITTNLFYFFKEKFPDEYKKIIFSHVMNVQVLQFLLMNGEIQKDEIPKSYLLRLFSITINLTNNEFALRRIIRFYYEQQIPFEYSDELPEICIFEALRTGRLDLANEFYHRTKVRPSVEQLLKECDTVESIDCLSQTDYVGEEEYIDYLEKAINTGNYEIIELFGKSILLEKIINPSFIYILEAGLTLYPMLDVALRILGEDQESIYNLFFPSTSESSSPNLENLRTRLAEMFVLNSLVDLEHVVNIFILPYTSPEVSVVINEELVKFRKIGLLVARSRKNNFFKEIACIYHTDLPNHLSSTSSKIESSFTKFAKNQISYGLSLLELQNTAPKTYSLFQCYNKFLRRNLATSFTEGRAEMHTIIGGRYSPFIQDIETTRAETIQISQNENHQAPSASPNSSQEIINVGNTWYRSNYSLLEGDAISFFVTVPNNPTEKIRLTEIGVYFKFIMGSGLVCVPYCFLHTPEESIHKYSPYHTEKYNILKQPRDINNVDDFNSLIDEIADFVWCNSHLCYTPRGNAQITVNIMNHLFGIHNIQPGAIRIDVTYLDCKALCTPRERFVREFKSYFESFPVPIDLPQPS